MDDRTFETLELGSLLELLAANAYTPLGRKRALNLRPSIDTVEINRALDLTTECASYLAGDEKFGLSGIEDPEQSLAQLQVEGTSLDPHQILAMERLISVGMDLRRLFGAAEARENFPLLADTVAKIPDLRRLLSSLHGKILPGGEIDDGASPELRQLRREISGLRTRIHHVLEAILRSQPSAVQDEIITFRNDRFVIPVRTDSRSHVPGVVHGLSSSGQTTFVEPLSVIERNNDLVRLREQEETEIARILFSMTEELRANVPGILAVKRVIEEIDFAQAKGRLSLDYKCSRPQMSNGRRFMLRDARHILLERTLRKSGGTVVPVSLELDEWDRVLVISGPNAGGKTVVVKTAGLIALMAQMGLHVPVREAVLPVFRQVFADIGDQQSISASLSTFTAHMRNVAEMARLASPTSLILLDEVGTGTDPDEGAALAIAIVDFFRRAGATSIATTHYPALKIWAAQHEEVRNASVEFDEQSLQPTFRLIPDIAGASSGLEIARRMEVPDGILQAARSLVDPAHAQARDYLRQLKKSVDEQEALRRVLEEEKAVAARQKAKLEDEFARREAVRRSEIDEALARITRDFAGESARLLQGVKDRVESNRLRKFTANRSAELKRAGEKFRRAAVVTGAAQAGAPSLPEKPAGGPPSNDLLEGDRVRILSVKNEGTIESIQDNTYTVMLGALRFRTGREDLQLVARGAAVPSQPPGYSPHPELDASQSFVPEIKVIGMTSDEALERVDKFLDEALLAGAENLRIVHGHGKGILRRAIAQFLAAHPQVEKFELAPPNQGGGGATLVQLRK